MSDFSPLNIFKSQAKQLARDQGLKLSVAQETLVQKAGFADYHELSVVAQPFTRSMVLRSCSPSITKPSSTFAFGACFMRTLRLLPKP